MTRTPRPVLPTAGLLCAAALLAGLVGCSQSPDASSTPAAVDSRSPAASPTPLFSSDAAALAAATKAYKKYLKVSDEIARDGGKDPERIRPYVTADEWSTEQSDFATYISRGWHAEGTSSMKHEQIEQRTANGVNLYLCLDVSGVRVFDANEVDQTPSGRKELLPLELEYVSLAGKLLIERSEQWHGSGVC